MLSLENIPLDDKKTFELLASGATKGVFQLESPLGRNYCKKVKPKSIEEIADVISLIRPGCLEAYIGDKTVTQHYCDRKSKLEEIEYPHESIKNILEPTLGLLIYQESAMEIAKTIAGFDLKLADELRKAAGKKSVELMAKVKTQFLDGVDKTGIVPKNIAENIFQNIEASQRYAFNRCVSGDIIIARPNKTNRFGTILTIEEMYNIRNDIEYAKKTRHLELYRKWRRIGNYGCGLSLQKDNKIRTNTIIDIQPAGIQTLYEIILENGATIKATANHKFPSDKGILELNELDVGDTLYTRGNSKTTRYKTYGFSNIKIQQLRSKKIQHDHVTVGFMSGKQNPGYTNGAYTEYINNIDKLPKFCELCGSNHRRLEIHHKDQNRSNNKLSNLQKLCPSCHKKEEYKLGRTKIWEKGCDIEVVAIKSIKKLGKEKVWDVTMDAPNHNFVTYNGIVTCNSHGIGYAKLSYYTAYLKTHYPIQFYISWLSNAHLKIDPKKELAELIDDARQRNIDIQVPDLRLLNHDFVEDNGKIRFGFNSIKSLGESTLEKIKKSLCDTEHVWNKSRTEWSWLDFLIGYSDSISKTAVEALVKVGAIDYTGVDRKRAWYEYTIWSQLTQKEKDWCKGFDYNCDYMDVTFLYVLQKLAPVKKEGGGTTNKNRSHIIYDLIKTLENPPYELKATATEKANDEIKYLGVALDASPVEDYEDLQINCTCEMFTKKEESKSLIILGVEIIKIREHIIKNGKQKGQKMLFLTAQDETGVMSNITVFPFTIADYDHLLKEGAIVYLLGYRDYNYGSFNVNAVHKMRNKHFNGPECVEFPEGEQVYS